MNTCDVLICQNSVGSIIIGARLREKTVWLIIPIGLWVKLQQTLQSRIWSSQRIKEYHVKGFTLNGERLKPGGFMSYFTKLQEHIWDIQITERYWCSDVLMLCPLYLEDS